MRSVSSLLLRYSESETETVYIKISILLQVHVTSTVAIYISSLHLLRHGYLLAVKGSLELLDAALQMQSWVAANSRLQHMFISNHCRLYACRSTCFFASSVVTCCSSLLLAFPASTLSIGSLSQERDDAVPDLFVRTIRKFLLNSS